MSDATEERLISGADFFRRLTGFFGITSTFAVFGIAAYLYALMRLSPEEWRGFLELLAFIAPGLFAGTTLLNRPLHTPITRYLDADAAGEGTPEGLRAAFRAVTDLPYRFFLSGLFWWAAAGVGVGIAMAVRFDTFGLFRLLVLAMAASSAGFVCSVFMFFGLKRLFPDVRSELGRRIVDPEERQGLVRRVEVGRKLRWSVTGVTSVTVSFALFLSLVHVSEPLEANAVRIQQRFLVARADALREDPTALERVAEEARALGIASEVVFVDLEDGEALVEETLLLSGELSKVGAGDATGTSLDFDSPHAFAWLALGDGQPIVVAVQPWELIAPAASMSWIRFALTLLVSAGIALALATQLSRDIGETTRELGSSAERVASGDLRRGNLFESEDELGELSRSFERMSGALRATVKRVAETADRVEANAAETATVSESVASAAEAQGQGVVETARAMQGVTAQSSDISRSAQELNALVEDSSSSIIELGASGEQLADTATVLFTKVDEVSSSIQEGVQSMREVSSNTETLAEAAESTSSSMAEMSTALKEVSNAAEDSAERSQRVVDTAERGRTTVRQTVESMESIRNATDSAEGVIRGLGERAREIGSIVDVIGDVADETNLLALNAAIIAAQAGEHGRAFGVVAEEIKELADRVLSSTKEIGDLIRAVQGESENAARAIAAGSASVAEGVELSTEADASLEEITRVSRESGERIHQILEGVQAQAQASGYVVELMESVKDGVDAIQRATSEQDRGNEVIVQSTETIREIAQQLQETTTEQARGSVRIRESIEGVRGATASINSALKSQSESCEKVGGFLEELSTKGQSNEESARRMQEVTRQLTQEANALREDVERFRL